MIDFEIKIAENTLKKLHIKSWNTLTIHDVLGKKHSSAYQKESLFNVETDIKYEGYVNIERERIKKLSKLENTKIPNNINYLTIQNLSTESKEKLMLVKPETLGQASRIAGVRSSDIMLVAFSLKK